MSLTTQDDMLQDSGQAGATQITPVMIEAGVDAYFLSRVEEHMETMADCREIVRSILLAGLQAHPQAY